MPSHLPEDMDSAPDRSKQSSLAALLQRAQEYAPRTNKLSAAPRPPSQPARGEVWLTKASETVESDPPEPMTVLLLERFDGDANEPTLFTAAPIFSNTRMAGPADAVLPREILGFEAGVAFASAGSLLPETLVSCEGTLPEDCTADLVGFFDYVRGVEEDPPIGVLTGAPYIDENDPAFVFHEELAEQMQALATPVLERLTEVESSEVPGWFSTAFEALKGKTTESANEWWEACAFLIYPPKSTGLAGLDAGATVVPGLRAFLVGAEAVGMAAHGLRRGVKRPFCKLSVGNTEAIVLLQACRTPTGAFGLEVLADPEHRIEGADVLNASGQVVATVADRKSGEPFRLDDNRLLLRLREGEFVPLRRITEDHERSE